MWWVFFDVAVRLVGGLGLRCHLLPPPEGFADVTTTDFSARWCLPVSSSLLHDFGCLAAIGGQLARCGRLVWPAW